MESAAATHPRRARYGQEVRTLRAAQRNFLSRPSPYLIGAAIAAAVVGRVLVGDIGWWDLAALAAMLVIYPFGEWAIHVYLLHMRPFTVFGRRVHLVSARAHGVHHRAPHDLDQLLLAGWQVAGLLAISALVAVGGGLLTSLVAGEVPWGPVLTALATAYALILGYEWTHLLIHTAYVPRTKAYRSVWRNHRLHHFKNERFWHGVTNNLSDRVLRTNPDQREVERSETARTLHEDPTG